MQPNALLCWVHLCFVLQSIHEYACSDVRIHVHALVFVEVDIVTENYILCVAVGHPCCSYRKLCAMCVLLLSWEGSSRKFKEVIRLKMKWIWQLHCFCRVLRIRDFLHCSMGILMNYSLKQNEAKSTSFKNKQRKLIVLNNLRPIT